MKLSQMITMSREEVNEQIPYAFICETRYGTKWDSLRRKSRWVEEFSAKERELARTLFRQSHRWYLVTGVPEDVVMGVNTRALWDRIADFCYSL